MSAADLAPSIDQVEAVPRILSDLAHPLLTGNVVHGHRALFTPRSGIYWLLVEETAAPDEIWATPLVRVYAIAGDGSFKTAYTPQIFRVEDQMRGFDLERRVW